MKSRKTVRGARLWNDAYTGARANLAVSVAYGTPEVDAAAALDKTVEVLGTQAERGEAAISWTIEGYDATTTGEYIATGVLTLPGGWMGTAENVTATVTVMLQGER